MTAFATFIWAFKKTFTQIIPADMTNCKNDPKLKYSWNYEFSDFTKKKRAEKGFPVFVSKNAVVLWWKASTSNFRKLYKSSGVAR